MISARKIVVRVTNWVGDAVMSLPALQHLRRALPNAEIVLLARPWVAELYSRENFADQVLVCEDRGVRARLRLAADLRAQRFDCALLLPNSFDAALVAWLARIPRRIGYDQIGRAHV